MRHLSLLFLALILGLFSKAQHRCAHDEIHHNLPSNLLLQEWEARTELNEYLQFQSTPKIGTLCSDGIYRIPVVVHVVHNNGSENISMAQINSQIQVLNEDYRKKTATPGFGGGVDTQIEFYLANIDPYGAPTSGVTRTVDSLTLLDLDLPPNNDSLLRELIHWPQTSYMNVYVVDSIYWGSGGYALGFAFLPMNAWNLYDGIVIADEYFGDSTGTAIVQPYHKGRTLTHEVGHYLGLFHTFGVNGGAIYPACDGTSATDCSTKGDYICDTPPQYGALLGTPPVTTNSCTETPTDNNDPVKNYMGYVDDVWANEFTNGQKTRMQGVLNTDAIRSNLVTNMNQVMTGSRFYSMPDVMFGGHNVPNTGMPFMFAPTFMAGVQACAGDSIYLYDLTLGTMYDFMNNAVSPATPDTKWRWYFTGANIDSSDLQNPVIHYTDTGKFSVTLRVTNNAGVCSFTMPQFIHIQGIPVYAISDSAEVGNPTSFTCFSGMPGSFLWDFGDDGTNTDTSTLQYPQYTYPGEGNYNFSVSFTPEDSTMCVSNYKSSANVSAKGNLLPVEWLSFTGESEERTVNLYWSTAVEINNEGYEVQGSIDGVEFSKLGFVPGIGNSRSVQEYKYIHKNEGSNLISYYRLKQIDFNQQYEYSEIISVRFTNKENDIKVFPNPTNDILKLSTETKITQLSLKNAFGYTLYQSMNMNDINMIDYKPGIYFLEIKDGQGQVVHFEKILKL